MRKIKLNELIILFSIILFSAIGSAGIISVHSGGDSNLVTIPNEVVEGFYFGQIPPAVGPGGGGGGGPRVILDLLLCNETYNYINLYDTNLSFVGDFILDIKNRKNITFEKIRVINFIENWQIICNDVMNRTLEEDLVCSQTREFLGDKITFNITDVGQLQQNLSSEINISIPLLTNYMTNLDEKCPIEKPFITLDTPIKRAVFFAFLGFLFLLMFFIVKYNKKKLIVPIVCEDDDFDFD